MRKNTVLRKLEKHLSSFWMFKLEVHAERNNDLNLIVSIGKILEENEDLNEEVEELFKKLIKICFK